MPLAFILSVLAALVISENAPQRPVDGAGIRFLLALAGMMLVALFAAITSGVTAQRLRLDHDRCDLVLRRFRWLRRIHAVLWLVAAGAILYGLGWGQLVRFNLHLNRVLLVDDVLILAPVVMPMVLSWAAFYEVDRAVRLRIREAASLAPDLPTRSQYVALHLRHYLGILLLPVLGLVAFQDAAELIAPGWTEARYAAVLYIVPFLLLLLLFPVLLRHVWLTCPLPSGRLRDRLLDAARRFRFQSRDILVWHTGGLLANAAVAGFIPGFRYMFLTDGLLSHLDEDEIEAVFAHEAGHVKHRHLLWRILAMVAPLSLWLLAAQRWPGTLDRLGTWFATSGLGLQVPMGLATLGAMALYVFFVFGFYSRLLEAQADLFGFRALRTEVGPCESPAATLISALEKLAALNGTDRKASSWQHGSIARRVALMHRAATDPAFRRRYHRRIALLNALVVVVVASPVLYRLLIG
jgi:STE24 endopeptidase